MLTESRVPSKRTSIPNSDEFYYSYCRHLHSAIIVADLRGATTVSSEAVVSEHDGIGLFEKGAYYALLTELDHAAVIDWDRENDHITRGHRFRLLSEALSLKQG